MTGFRVLSDVQAGERFGPFVLVRLLRAGVMSARWMARHTLEETHHVVHVFELGRDRSERRRFLKAVERAAALTDSHVLPIEQFSLSQNGRGWVVTPYTGDQDGLLLLPDLVEAKSGRLGLPEVARVVEQLLRASAACHGEAGDGAGLDGVCHGVIDGRQVLIDRRGAIRLELYGVEQLMTGSAMNGESVRDEVRSVATLAYECLTGVVAEEPLIKVERLVKRLPRAWRIWFDRALDSAGGFATAQDALAMVPGADVQPAASRTEIKALREKAAVQRVR